MSKIVATEFNKVTAHMADCYERILNLCHEPKTAKDVLNCLYGGKKVTIVYSFLKSFVEQGYMEHSGTVKNCYGKAQMLFKTIKTNYQGHDIEKQIHYQRQICQKSKTQIAEDRKNSRRKEILRIIFNNELTATEVSDNFTVSLTVIRDDLIYLCERGAVVQCGLRIVNQKSGKAYKAITTELENEIKSKDVKQNPVGRLIKFNSTSKASIELRKKLAANDRLYRIDKESPKVYPSGSLLSDAV